MRKKAIIITALAASLLTVSVLGDETGWDGAFDAPPVIEEEAAFDEESAVEEQNLFSDDELMFEEEITVEEETASEETDFVGEGEEEEAVFISEEDEEIASESSSNAAIAAAQDLVYTGEAQALLIVSSEADGTEYSLDGENFSAEVPSGINAGEYVVYIRNTAGDEITTVTVSIGKADVIFTPPVPNTTA